MSVRKRRWITAAGEAKESWVVDYVNGKDRQLKTFERKKDADDFHNQVKVDIRKGTYIAPSKSPTVAEAAAKWLAEADARGLERTTLSQYDEHTRKHILPLIGHDKLAELSPDRVE